MSFDRLDRSIRAYVKAPAAMDGAEPLTFSALPIVEEHEEPESTPSDEVGGDAALLAAVAGEKEDKKEVVDPAAVVYAIPE